MESSDGSLVHAVPAGWSERAHANASKYKEMYELSVSAPEEFWGYHGKRIDWIKPFTKVKNTCFDPGKVAIKWFEDGITNVAMNCIDRHLATRGDQTAIIWEGDDPGESKHITYGQLHDRVCRFANVLKNHGVKKGDTVTIYLPMIRKRHMPCWHAHELARFIPSCLEVFRRTRSPGESRAALRKSS
jgi:acetyl-CoA synthetase